MGIFGFFKSKTDKGVSREAFAALMGEVAKQRRQLATYDAARNGTEYENIWANADRFDADSAHSRQVRETLISRSRYETVNNGYSDGIAQTFATDLIGIGPKLRMQTKNAGFNQLVEMVWSDWANAVQLRRKLWCMAHAKHVDGETFGVIRRNRRVPHPLGIDVTLHESEQCQTPYRPYEDPNYIDGIKFDEFGNPLWYDFLQYHPGSQNSGVAFDNVESIAADRVLHWYRMRRPGQHRGVPESASTLNLGASARRWREATLAAAETAADFSLIVKTQQTPDDADPIAPFSEMDITKRMMSFMPMGWDPFQLKAEFPTATHEAFSKALVNEQARPQSMPYNKAACDSSDYNYASGRLDHQTYYAHLDVDREDCNRLVLDQLFYAWFELAAGVFGWTQGVPSNIRAIRHSWDWPKHRVADVESEAKANEIRLKSGQVGLHQLYSDSGYDLEDEIPKMAETFQVTPEEVRKRLFDSVLPPVVTGGNGDSSPSQETSGVNGRRFNGNGVLNAN